MQENPLERRLGPPLRFFALLAGYGILAITLLVGIEIVLRRLFDLSLQGADEYGGYALAVITSVGAAYALLERGHTRLEILTERLPAAVRALLNGASALLLAAMASFLAWRAVVAVQESIEYQSLSGTPLMTPLWIPQSVWAGGMILFALVAVAIALHCLLLSVRNWRAVDRWYGIKTLSEEIREASRSGSGPGAEPTTPAPRAITRGEVGA